MSFQQLTLYSGTTCAPGSAIFGTTSSVSALTNGKSTCSTVVGSGVRCKAFGTVSESLLCSNGAQDLTKLISGPAFTITIYTDTNCGTTLQTAAAVLDKCISIAGSASSAGVNTMFTVLRDGTVGTTMYDDSGCKVVSKNQAPASSLTIPQCEGQITPALGQCAKIPAVCVSAMSSQLNGVIVGSFKYDRVVDQITAVEPTAGAQTGVQTTKSSSASAVGLSLVSGLAAMFLF
ncbi:hypothetical protein HDU79_011368 [Rhizoclosmatium sp. JEL0117]|nr:hypothetical protein HDU79_011368 [Rhizoclosmatium sp. JEL0117]